MIPETQALKVRFLGHKKFVFSSFSSLSLSFHRESAGEIGPDKNRRYTCILLLLIEAVLDAHSCRL